ncbi:MAG: serine hydrolase [Desulfomonile tiedjei]|nr:serine hydrolase [Desulfomonile tiedjei]
MRTMPTKVIVVFVSVLLLSALPFANPFARSEVFDEAEVASAIKPLVKEGLYVGIAIGLITREGQAVYGFGSVRRGENLTPDRDTVFALASISKVFTGTLLADTVLHGKVKLDDPIGPFLPTRVTTHRGAVNKITFLDLATHTSGLPRMAPRKRQTVGFTPREPMTLEEMYAFLSTFRLSHNKKPEFLYSNLAIALLGQTLALVNHESFDAMLQQRICGPLKMNSTRAWPNENMRRYLAQGYNKIMEPVTPRKLLVGKSSGGLYSTAGDMLKFLAANLGMVDAPIVPAMKFAQAPRRLVNEQKNAYMGLAWHVRQVRGTDIVSKNGGIPGFQSYVAFSPQEQVGVVALANSGPKGRKLDAAARTLLLRMIEKSRAEKGTLLHENR